VGRRLELSAGSRANPLRRRIGCDELRVLLLEVDELAVEAIVLFVRDGRLVEVVIEVIVLAKLCGEIRMTRAAF